MSTAGRSPTLARLVLPLLVAGCSGVFLLEALDRWRFARICALTCGPFWEVGTVELIRSAMDWHTPLTLEALPPVLVLMCAKWLRRRGGGSVAAPRPR